LPKRWESNSEPPFEGRELLEYLLEIGLLRRRADGRVDVPDLFLSGLGLKRKGGVKKPVDLEQETLSYNGLVQSRPEITRLAREGSLPAGPRQQELL